MDVAPRPIERAIPRASARPAGTLVEIALLALVYLALGRLGQAVAVQQVTAIFPSAGVAVAALLLRGRRVWPGIFAGSLALNVWYSQDAAPAATVLLVAAGMATGATLEGLATATLLARLAGGRSCLDRTDDVLRFFAIAMGASALSATIGVLSLSAGGIIPWRVARDTWSTWWMGDTAGIALVAPAILAFAGAVPAAFGGRAAAFAGARGRGRLAEAAALLLLLLVMGQLTLAGVASVEYAYIPCLVAAAFRFGERGATLALLLVAGIALHATVAGQGSFATPDRGRSLIALQTFMVIIALTTLLLTAVLGERDARKSELVAALADLERARNAAEQASLAKSTFLANMSHELRTPLNAIIGYADMMLEDDGAGAIAEHGGDLEKIRGAGKHLLAVVSDILDMAKIEAGRMELALETFPVAPLLEEVAAAARPLAAARGNALEAAAAELGALHADRAKVRDVLANLLANACKFTKDGRVELRAVRDAEGVTFTVADTGAGISPSDQARLFQPFTQADGSHTRRHDGSGLGLAISQRYAAMLGGFITCESAVGRGSTFSLRLPSGRAASSSAPSSSPSFP